MSSTMFPKNQHAEEYEGYMERMRSALQSETKTRAATRATQKPFVNTISVNTKSRALSGAVATASDSERSRSAPQKVMSGSAHSTYTHHRESNVSGAITLGQHIAVPRPNQGIPSSSINADSRELGASALQNNRSPMLNPSLQVDTTQSSHGSVTEFWEYLEVQTLNAPSQAPSSTKLSLLVEIYCHQNSLPDPTTTAACSIYFGPDSAHNVSYLQNRPTEHLGETYRHAAITALKKVNKLLQPHVKLNFKDCDCEFDTKKVTEAYKMLDHFRNACGSVVIKYASNYTLDERHSATDWWRRRLSLYLPSWQILRDICAQLKALGVEVQFLAAGTEDLKDAKCLALGAF